MNCARKIKYPAFLWPVLFFGCVLFFKPLPGSAGHEDCVRFLAIARPAEAGQMVADRVDGTPGLIAYLSDLLSRRVIDRQELTNFIAGLERGLLENPLGGGQMTANSVSLIHRSVVQDYIAMPDLNRAKLLAWARRAISNHFQEESEKAQVNDATRDPYSIRFHLVRPGKFLSEVGQSRRKPPPPIRLEHSFEAMSMPVTQRQWIEIMGHNPSRFSDGKGSVTVSVRGKQIRMRPDHPVEMITWWSAIVFANELSKKYGLKPVYILDEVPFVDGDRSMGDKNWTCTTPAEIFDAAARGVLDTRHQNWSPKIDAPHGVVAHAEGFRLPSLEEQEFLMRGRGEAKGVFYFGNNAKELEYHAWYQANAADSTQPVGQKHPLVIDGNSFFDIYGNVEEWSHDWVNPGEVSMRRAAKGGSWKVHSNHLRPHSSSSSYYREDDFGFRLVRTVK